LPSETLGGKTSDKRSVGATLVKTHSRILPRAGVARTGVETLIGAAGGSVNELDVGADDVVSVSGTYWMVPCFVRTLNLTAPTEPPGKGSLLLFGTILCGKEVAEKTFVVLYTSRVLLDRSLTSRRLIVFRCLGRYVAQTDMELVELVSRDLIHRPCAIALVVKHRA
jgi:hypothetical protein